MTFEFSHDPTACFVSPALIIWAAECETPDCGDVHGYGLTIHWFFWGFTIAIPTK